MAAPDDMVDVPSRLIREWLIAYETAAMVCFPEHHQLSLTIECCRHRPIHALLKVDFPGRVVGICYRTEFDISLDGGAGCRTEVFPLSLNLPEEHPVASATGVEIAGFDPACGLGGVMAFCPTPKRLKEGAVDVAKGACADDVSVVLCPATDNWVEDLGGLDGALLVDTSLALRT